MEKQMEANLGFAVLSVELKAVGEDLLILFRGGDLPHIGCVVLAQPRCSLKKNGARSATSSVLNVMGHKDEQIARVLAEKAAAKYGKVTVCAGGFHKDGMTGPELETVMRAAKELAGRL